MHVENVPHVVAACCVLHNICEIHGDKFNDEWLQDIHEQEDVSSSHQQAAMSSSSTESGDEVRNVLVEYFHQNPL